MNDQLGLVFSSDATIQARFEEFHRANPFVYDELVKLAEQYQRRGYSHIGIGHLVEIVRWQRNMATVGDDFKLNNNFRSRYVRLLIEQRPDLAPMFETRELRAA